MSMEGNGMPFRKSLWVLGILVLLVAPLSILRKNQDIDDAFIAYRYVRNIVNGQGWVFNRGERVNGVTSPLHVLLLSAASAVVRDVPLAARLVDTPSLIAAGFLVFRMLSRLGYATGGLIGAAALVTFPPIHTTYGLETMPYLALAALSMHCSLQGKRVQMAVALGFLVLTRPDGILLAGVLFIADLMRGRWARTAGTIALFVLIQVPWFSFATFYFGSPLPQTLHAKMAQGAAGITLTATALKGRLPMFLQGMISLASVHWEQSRLFGFGVVLVAAGIATAWRRKEARLLPTLAWPVIHITAYALLNVPPYHWYYAPVFLVGALLIGLGAEGMSRAMLRVIRVNEGAVRLFSWTVAGILALPLLIANVGFTVRLSVEQTGLRPEYVTLARWLRDHTPPGATVGTSEIGVVGFYSDRRILDYLAIVTPASTVPLRRGDAAWWVTGAGPDYAILHDPPWPFEIPIRAHPEFVRRYRLVWSLEHRPGERLLVYRRE